MAAEIFQLIGESLENATAHYVTDTATRLITDFTPIAITGIGLFITCYGYLIMAGHIQEPFKEFLLKATKIIIVSALALHTSTYLDWVVSAINGLQSGLGAAVGHTDTSSSIYQILDNMLDKGLVIMKKCWENARNTSWMRMGDIVNFYIDSVLVAASTIIIVVTGGMIVMVASIMLKIMLAIGPIFIMCLMWPLTAKFFDAWFAQTLTYILKTVFVVVVISFAIEIFSQVLGSIDVNSDLSGTKTSIMLVETTVAGYLLYKVVMEVAGMAAGLAGGISASTMSIGRLMSEVTSPMRLFGRGRREGGGGSSRATPARAKTGGANMEGSALGQSSASSSATPIYQRRLMENLQNGFSKK